LAPALSYLDHPPMVAWMIAAGRSLGGDNALGIRLAAVLTSLVGPLLLWRTVLILFGATVARSAVWFALAMPLLSVGGIIITPDTPSVLFWGLTGWALAELYASGNPNWWLAVGLFAGLGLLSKYTNLFVGAGIVVWLLGARENWRWLRAWQLWAGGLIAALLTLPIVVWNGRHDWASLGKQFGRVVRDQAFAPGYLLEMLGSVLGLASPLIAALALAGLWQVLRAAATRREQPSLLLTASLIPLLGYFLVHALHARVQPNWLAPLYPALATCAAIAASAHWPRGRAPHLWPRAIKAAPGLGFVMSGLVLLHAVQPLVHLPAGKDPSSQLRGWRAFALKVDRVRQAEGACWVATSHYSITGQLAYHLPAPVPVVPLTEPLRYAHLPVIAASTFACPGLYVELARRSPPAELERNFASVVALGTLSRSDRGQDLADYRVMRLSEPRAAITGLRAAIGRK
jgi:4-amino-4-deoxy-L-arabinose transferase-like glycosyltransferase